MDLDLCIKCDECVKACESLHGESRLIRNGIQLGKYLVPSACRHCDDPKCMNSCPTGAIKRRPEGEIYFQYDMCIGCGNCAIACPYDNIAMIDTPTFDKAQARKAHAMNDANFFRPIRWPRMTRAKSASGNVCSDPGASRRKCANRLRCCHSLNMSTFRPLSRSIATSATDCLSWDACTTARLARRSGSIRPSSSPRPARSLPARVCARLKAAAISARRLAEQGCARAIDTESQRWLDFDSGRSHQSASEQGTARERWIGIPELGLIDRA